MPAGYSQMSAARRAERQAQAGWTYVGGDPDEFERINGVVRRRDAAGPDLPPYPPGGGEWLHDARDWYYAFRRSPQADMIQTDIEWISVQHAAGLYNSYLMTGNLGYWKAFASLMERLGTTPGDRRKLRLGIAAEANESEADSGAPSADQAAFDAEFEALLGDM